MMSRKDAISVVGAITAATTANWSGTVSFWLSVDPATQLDLGFCDPI